MKNNFRKKRKKIFNRPSVPLHRLFPSIITLMALSLGITAVRYAVDGQFRIAISFIFFAAFLDILDGRLARMLNATSEFGAQLDSLADAVNFGVAPSLITYSWCNHYFNNMSNFGKNCLWLSIIIYVSCAAMRLARFNVQSNSIKKGEILVKNLTQNIKNQEFIHSNKYNNDLYAKCYYQLISEGRFFNGIPSTVAGLLMLIPIIIGFEIIPEYRPSLWIFPIYNVFLAIMMVAIIPTISSKKLVIKRKNIPLVFIIALCFLATLIFEPWVLIPLIALIYLSTLPISYFKCRKIIINMIKERNISVIVEKN